VRFETEHTYGKLAKFKLHDMADRIAATALKLALAM